MGGILVMRMWLMGVCWGLYVAFAYVRCVHWLRALKH